MTPSNQAAVGTDTDGGDQVRKLLREDLRGRTPYGALQLDVAVRLNTNENSCRLPEDVAAAVESALSSQVRGLNRYPDREAENLRAELAEYLGAGVTTSRVWAANGSNEILQQLLQAFGGPGRTALGFTPSYSMHPNICATTSTAWHEGVRASDFSLSPDSATAQVRRLQPDVVFLCSPNNPTGAALNLSVVEAVLAETSALVVVDEAYAEFARDGFVSAVSLLKDWPRLAVTRTMSKAFGLAGARLGYVAAEPAVVEALQLVRLPYHLSSLTQAAALAALHNAAGLLAAVDEIRSQRDRLVRELSQLGLKPAPSDANFVLFGGLADSSGTWRALIDRGVLIRDVGIPGWLRVTAGTADETDAFLEALQEVLQVTREKA